MPDMPPLRVVLADDQVLFREGLRALLAAQANIEVVGDAENGQQVLCIVTEQHPDVVLMDVRMPIMDGVTATRRLKNDHANLQIILLTTFDDDEYVFEGLRAGAIGYLLKDAPVKQLIEALQMAARGETFLQPSIAAKLIAELKRQTASPASASTLIEPLTSREIEILRSVASGRSNREIAEQFVITEGTVKNHMTSILGKLGVRDRTQAVLKAQELRLV
jgi:DNA-binding NarL/FixJ family response regulator